MQKDDFANFIEAVRSRKVSIYMPTSKRDIFQRRFATRRTSRTCLVKKADPEAIKAAVKSDAASLDTFERFAQHMATNEIDLSMDKAVLGVPLKINAKTERFIDNEAANGLLKRVYRAAFCCLTTFDLIARIAVEISSVYSLWLAATRSGHRWWSVKSPNYDQRSAAHRS